MKRILVFLVLLSHMNFSMFMPQVYEVDQYDIKGTPVDDINSLYEYVDQIVLDNSDSSPEDEDNDTGQHFHLEKIDTYCFTQQCIELKASYYTIREVAQFPPFVEQEYTPVFFDIPYPPPEV